MIKKLVFKATVMVAAVFGAMLVLPGPDGQPMMQISDLPGYGLFTAAEKAVDTAAEKVEELQGNSEIYTWVDDNGQVHFSDTPVAGSSAHELSATNDAIPAENFTGAAYNTSSDRESRPKSFLISDSSSRKGNVGGSARGKEKITAQDFQNLAEGDFSNAREVLNQLPEYLKDAHEKRESVLK